MKGSQVRPLSLNNLDRKGTLYWHAPRCVGPRVSPPGIERPETKPKAVTAETLHFITSMKTSHHSSVPSYMSLAYELMCTSSNSSGAQ